MKPLYIVRLAGLALLLTMASSACIQQTNTYPIEIFGEMHYSQSYRISEPDRPVPVAEAITVDRYGSPLNNPEHVLDVEAARNAWVQAYTPSKGRQLFVRYCSSCHGETGLGDGPVAAHFTHPQSYYVTANNASAPYAGPANLQITRQDIPKETSYFTVLNGRNGMPNFKHLSDETIITVLEYVYDDMNGLGSTP